MIRGSSQEFRYKLPCAFDDLAEVRISFWQDNYKGPANYRPLPIIKIKAQCQKCDQPDLLSVTLNQEETLRFSDRRKAKVQLRALTTSGVPIVAREQLLTVYPVHDDSILDGDIVPTPTYDDFIILDGQNII